LTAPKVKAAVVKDAPAERSWMETWGLRLVRLLGSLQVAVVGLTLFAFVLAIGTIVESWYSGKVAGDLVYRTWWFDSLLLALGVNIFFAAAKKWRWKKHQTGFLITHVGLLCLVGGGLVSSIGGVDSLLVLVDSPNPEQQREGGAPQQNGVIQDRNSG